MPLQGSNLGDLVADTLRDLGEMKVTEITTDLQDFVAMNTLLRENNVKLESGYGIQWNIMVNTSGNARFVGLFAVDNTNVGDTQIQASIDWRHLNTSYAIEDRELAMNRSPRRIVDLLKIRRYDAMIDLAKLLEAAFWGYPLSTDTVTPNGIAYWIVKSATAAIKANNDGFNGTVQSGYTTVAGVNPTTYPRWRNYSDAYAGVTKDDFVRKARRAVTHCVFRPPANNGPADFNTGDKWGMYTTYPVVSKLEDSLENQNDNLGNDVASKDGQVMLRRVPVKWVPHLDNDTTDPMYGINWGVVKTHILRGEWLNETKIDVTPGQHRTCTVHTDSTLQWVVKDRRRNFVLSNGTSTPSA